MSETFYALLTRFASKEITFSELQEIESSGICSFENRGISRTKPSCLHCIVTFDALVELIDKIVATTFANIEALDAYIASFGLSLSKELDEKSTTITYYKDSFIEIIAEINPDGTVSCTNENIEATTEFGVYLPISC